MRENKYTKFKQPIKLHKIGKTRPGLFNGGQPTTPVEFDTEIGLVTYWNDTNKWVNPGQYQFNLDILAAAKGENSGYFTGLKYTQKPNGQDSYVEFGRYSILDFEQAEAHKQLAK